MQRRQADLFPLDNARKNVGNRVYHLGKTNGSIALPCRNTTTFKGFWKKLFDRGNLLRLSRLTPFVT
jgi:hypothetical protein